MTPEEVLQQSPKFFRASTSHGAGKVDREGGMFGAGLITGVSVITRGEALGHEMWVDAEFLADVTAALNAQPQGIKARFTHPGLSSDGLGKYLGRITSAQTVGDQVVGNLHLAESAHEAPDGDLAAYVMQLAEDDAEAFGLSIVFENDLAAMELHRLENTTNDRFVSPDEDNKNNYDHARLGKLRAGDVVDEPAANPNGLFHRKQEIAADAEGLMAYALGISSERPELSCLSVDADRVQAAVSRFLARNDLSLQKVEPMTESTIVQPTREEFAAELEKYTTAFGAEHGQAWFKAGIDFDAATTVFDSIIGSVEELQAQVTELTERLASLDTGEDEPAEQGDADAQKPTGFRSRIRISGASNN